MKKIITLAAALSLLMSCNGKSNSIKTLDDTVSVKMGEMYGYGVRGEMNNGPEKIDPQEFLNGMAMVLNVDTANQSLVRGIGFGMNVQQLARQMSEGQKVNFDTKLFFEAFKRAFCADSLLDPQTIQLEVMELVRRCSAANKANDPALKEIREAGAKFIEEKVAEGAQKTTSGLAYKIIIAGNGQTFTENDQILVKYVGKHVNGEVFDQSGDKTVTMSPKGVIAGFREALLMMSPGAKYEVYIPGELAYGEEGAGDRIKPMETLIFELETVGVAVPEEKK